MNRPASSSLSRLSSKTSLWIVFLLLGAGSFLLLALAAGPKSASAAAPGAPSATPTAQEKKIVVEGKIDAVQHQALEKLSAASEAGVSLLARQGQVLYLELSVAIPNAQALGAREKAGIFLKQHKAVFQMRDVDRTLKFTGAARDETSAAFVQFQQQYQGVPVLGSEVIVSLDAGGKVRSVMANYSLEPEILVQPSIRSIRAEELALESFGTLGDVVGTTGLVIYDPALLSPTASQPRLAWLVMVAAKTELVVRSYVVDAQNEAVLLELDEVISARDREVWDAQGHPGSISDMFWIDVFWFDKQVMDEDGPLEGIDPIEDAERAWGHAGTVYDFYYNQFGRDSFDDDGAQMELYVNIGDCRNAFWVPFLSKAFFCLNVTGIDMLAHELTHGVWGAGTIREFYKGEAAALNESFADLFAAFIDTRDRWRITSLNEGGLVFRDLANLAENGFPTIYSQYDEDQAPQWNSTIHSYAVYLLAEGGKVGSIEVKQVDIEKLQHIYYNVMVHRLTILVNFDQTRRAAIAECNSLTGTYAITAQDCNQVMNAYAAIGIGEPAEDEPAPTLPAINLDFLEKWIESLIAKANDLPEDLWEAAEAKITELLKKLLAATEKKLEDLVKELLSPYLTWAKELTNFCCLGLVPLAVLPSGLLCSRWRKHSRGRK